MGHICDRYQQTVATTRARLTIDRVVKVPGGFVVDGHQAQVADIHPILLVLFAHLIGNAGNLLTDGRRPTVRDIVGTDGHIDFHTRCHVLAKYFHHLARWLGTHRRLAQDVDHDVLAVPCIINVLCRNQYFVVDASVLRNHKGDAAFLKQTTNGLMGTILQHLYNHPFATTTIVHPVHPGGNAVTVENLAHLAGCEEQIRPSIIRDQKTEPVLVSRDTACNKIRFFNGQVGSPAITDQLSVPAHGNQPAPKGFDALLGLLPQLATQSLVSGRRSPLLQMVENELPTLNWVVVFAGFTLRVWVFVGLLSGNHSYP